MISNYDGSIWQDKPETNQQLQAMRALVEGETPLIIAVSSEKDILNAISGLPMRIIHP